MRLDGPGGVADTAVEDAQQRVAAAHRQQPGAVRGRRDGVRLHQAPCQVVLQRRQRLRRAARLPPVDLAHCGPEWQE